MKKAKKLLSLFLAALMLMSCFGAISASAMTMDAAGGAGAEKGGGRKPQPQNSMQIFRIIPLFMPTRAQSSGTRR